MNQNAVSWIEALRSGTYTQTTGRLRRSGRLLWRRQTFCAMGVLYDLYLRAVGRSWPRYQPHGPLPDAVLQWAGISRELERVVVSHNDNGYNFKDLASIIEARLIREERNGAWWEAEQTVRKAIEKAQDSARRQPALVD